MLRMKRKLSRLNVVNVWLFIIMFFRSLKWRIVMGIVMGLVFFVVSTVVSLFFLCLGVGFPFEFCVFGFDPGERDKWNVLFLTIDIIFWFFVSFIIVFVFYKIRDRKRGV